MNAERFIEESRNLICTTDAQGVFTYVNPAFFNTCGYSKQEIQSRKLIDILHIEAKESTTQFFEKIKNKKDLVAFDSRCICKDGSTIYISWNAHWVKAENSIYLIGVNNTAQKAVELDLLRSNQLLEASQTISKTGGWELDLITNDLFWTEGTYQIHDEDSANFDPSVDAGIHFYLPEYRYKLTEALKNAIEKGEGYNLELRIKTRKGRIKDVRTNCKVIEDKGRTVKLVGAVQDITERKSTERKLVDASKEIEENKNYLNNIINYISDPIFLKDAQSKLMIVNDAFCELFGLSRPDIIGKTLAEDVRPEEMESFLKIDRQVIANGGEAVLEEPISVKGKQSKIISTKKSRFFDANGNRFLVGISRDISELKESEKKQKWLLQKMDLAIKAANLGVWTQDIQNKSSEWNEELYEIYGLTREQFKGGIDDWMEYIHHDDFEVVDKAFQGVLNGASIFGLEYRICKKDGEIRFVETSAVPFYNDRDEITNIIGVDRDITDRITVLNQLKTSEEKFSKAFENSPLPGSILHLTTGKRLAVNNVFVDSFGYSKEELLAGNIHWMKLVDDPKEFEMAIELYSQNGSLESFPISMRTKSGEKKSILVNASRLDPNDEAIVITSFIDITEQKENEIQLIEAKKKAEESDRLKSAFLSNMSHEIRTPLNGVIGFSNLLKNDELEPRERHEYLEIIDRNSKQLLNLIDDIIDLAKIESGQLNVVQKDCEVAKLITDLESLFNKLKLYQKKDQLRIVGNVPEQYSNLFIKTDGHRVRQVLSNLLGNALKFSKTGTIIRFFGVKDGQIVLQTDFTVGRNCCHIEAISGPFDQEF